MQIWRRRRARHRKSLLRALYPGRKECGVFEEPREAQCGWRTEDGDVVDDEGRGRSRDKNCVQPMLKIFGLSTYSGSSILAAHQNHLRNI